MPSNDVVCSHGCETAAGVIQQSVQPMELEPDHDQNET